MLEVNFHHSTGSAKHKILTWFGPIHNTEVSSGLIVTFQSFSLGLGFGPVLILQHIYGALGIVWETGQRRPNATIPSQQLPSQTPMTGKQGLNKSFLLLQLPPSNWKYSPKLISLLHPFKVNGAPDAYGCLLLSGHHQLLGHWVAYSRINPGMLTQCKTVLISGIAIPKPFLTSV